MEIGFQLDHGHANARMVADWVEGKPERSFWQGLKTKDRQVLDIEVYRCERCGYLESYARNPTTNLG